MNAEPRFPTSSCRLCAFYQPEGRRGGMCEKLGVPVKGCWQSCHLAHQVFGELELIDHEDKLVQLEHSLTLTYQPQTADLTVLTPANSDRASLL